MFPNSNYAEYDPALVAVISYNYYKYTADSVVKWGSYDPSASHEIFSNPDKSLVFPMAFNKSFTDTYAKTNYSDATTVSSNQTGSRTVTFNGFGTLQLPQGTFTNVALVSELRTNSLGPNSTTFTWFDISNGKQLLYYEENAGNIVLAYTTDLSSGITEIDAKYNSTLYPNPITDIATLRINSNTLITNAKLIIKDVLGKEVKSITVNSNEIKVDRSNLENGIYFYSVSNEQGIIAKGKLIAE